MCDLILFYFALHTYPLALKGAVERALPTNYYNYKNPHNKSN